MSRYNSYMRDFPMSLDRDKPLPEVARECYTDTSKGLDVEIDSDNFMGLNSSGDYKIDVNKPLTKTVTPNALNLRTEPKGNVIRCLKKDDVVSIGEKTDDGEWTHVYTDLGDGWVMSKYLE